MKKIAFILFSILSLTNAATAQTYTYDNNHQLTQIKYDNGAIITIQFDANGNRSNYLVSGGVPLPLQLLNFNAQKSGVQVLLTWSTSEEINTDKFDVEFSKDATVFVSFITLPARGNSTVRSDYSTLHCCPVEGPNYYRLKMIDRDGHYTYSEVRKIIFAFANVMKLYPNPAPEKAILDISFTKPFATDAAVTIYNGNGSKVYQSSMSKGELISKVNTASFAAGSYYVVVIGDGNQYKEKFVKQ